ncbi:MAG: TIGR00153 family protein [Gammaproteobacteria bacterium]|nr:TIGR00153 family protein [Gammaproteobacteria bacterium]
MAVSNYMSGIFGNSPVKPMQMHMEKVHECVSLLVPFFEAVLAEDWKKVEKTQQKISALENEADVLKKELRLNLPKGLFMQVSRRDLLEILTIQDSVANKAKDVAGLILGRKMVLPKQIANDYLKFVQRCVDASAQAKVTIDELDELVETGFRGTEVKLVQKMIKTLDKIEADTDKIQRKIRLKLFEIENDMPPLEAMFMYKVIEATGDVADQSQRVGSRLQLLLAR